MIENLLEPWVDVGDHGARLADELELEIAEGHPLWGKSAVAVARRVDTDDVLFEISQHNEPICFAVVHLTWSGEPEANPEWPSTQIFRSINEWIDSSMMQDHKQYRAS